MKVDVDFFPFHALAYITRLIYKYVHMSSFVEKSHSQVLYHYTHQLLDDDHLNFSVHILYVDSSENVGDKWEF